MYETELIWYVHKKTGQPFSPFFHKNQINLLEQWWIKNTVEPKRLEIVLFAWENIPSIKIRDTYISDQLKSFINEYEICSVCSKKYFK